MKSLIAYLAILISAFLFSIFYYNWFSWVLLLIIAAVPFASLLLSLPFMIASRRAEISFFNATDAADGASAFVAVESESRVFCPRLVIKAVAVNSFSGSRERALLRFSGRLSDGASLVLSKSCLHAGDVLITAKYARAYDFLGLFFIPLKKIEPYRLRVLPDSVEPELLPDSQSIVLGYKKSLGYSELYELRDFRDGDSPRSVHWKSSAKYDKLITKESTEPVYKRLILRPCFGRDAFENDDITARLIYCSRYLLERGCPFLCEYEGEVFEISDKEAFRDYLGFVFGSSKPKSVSRPSKAAVYLITASGEEVSGI